jgi:hypothetical protein
MHFYHTASLVLHYNPTEIILTVLILLSEIIPTALVFLAELIPTALVFLTEIILAALIFHLPGQPEQPAGSVRIPADMHPVLPLVPPIPVHHAPRRSCRWRGLFVGLPRVDRHEFR